MTHITTIQYVLINMLAHVLYTNCQNVLLCNDMFMTCFDHCCLIAGSVG
jgi:hypothetical protein